MAVALTVTLALAGRVETCAGELYADAAETLGLGWVGLQAGELAVDGEECAECCYEYKD